MRVLSPQIKLLRRCFVMKATKPETEKPINVDSTGIFSASVGQAEQDQVVPRLDRRTVIPLLEPAGQEISRETLELTSSTKVIPRILERTALPFEEIPGPAVLKIWEKYWRYVPLLGRLKWNRNVTPIHYLFDRYGSIVRINGPLVNDIVMIHRPEHVAQVFSGEGNVPIRSAIDILQHYHQHHRKNQFAGPFSLQGSEWMEMRRKLDKSFQEMNSNFVHKIDSVCDELVNRIPKIRNRQNEVPADFHKELTRWGMECFSTIVLNQHLGFLEPSGLSTSSEPYKMIAACYKAHKYMNLCETGFQVWRLFETPFAKKVFEACDVLDNAITKYVSQISLNKSQLNQTVGYKKLYTDGEHSSPVLEKMILIERITPNDLSTILIDMALLGVQATVNCQAFLLYFLAKNPRVQRRVFEEVTSISSDLEGPLSENSLKDMPYVRACLQECLRLRPAFPYLTRLLSSTISIHGYTVPKGTFVIMANQLACQREENYEDPEKFRPERWLQSDFDQEPHNKYNFLPFGYGARSCLGKTLAQTQMMLLTAKLVKQFRIEYDYSEIQSSFYMLNTPDKPLRFRFVDRD